VDVVSGREKLVLKSRGNTVAASPLGHVIAIGGTYARQVKIDDAIVDVGLSVWDTLTREPIATLSENSANVLEFAPDGSCFAAAMMNGNAIVIYYLSANDCFFKLPAKPSKEQMQLLWKDLGAKAGPAFQAILFLAAMPLAATEFIREHV